MVAKKSSLLIVTHVSMIISYLLAFIHMINTDAFVCLLLCLKPVAIDLPFTAILILCNNVLYTNRLRENLIGC